MKKIQWSILICFMASIMMTVYAQAAPAASSTKASGSGAFSEKNWNTLINDAKKEGTVVIYNTAWVPQVRISLAQAFKEKYGISLEFSPFARGAELLAKVNTEQRAGLYLADVFGAGAGTIVASMKPAGLLGEIEPLLIHPEVIDGKYWRGGKFPFLDKDKNAVGMIASVQRNIIYNTSLIKKGEINTYKDLLKPQFKGKITINDPRVSGSGKEVFLHLALNLWNMEEVKTYLTQLLKQQEAVIERDNRQHVEGVSRGKYAIGLGPDPDALASYLKMGAPVEAILIKEGVFVSQAAGCIGIPTKLVHPNATKLFLNWLLSKEGQTVFATSFGNPSLRTDVSSTQFNPTFLLQPQEKVFLASETSILFTNEITKVTKQIIEDVYK